MATARKITVELPAKLSEKPQKATGAGVTQTIPAGLHGLLPPRPTLPGQMREKPFQPDIGHLKLTDDAADTSTWIAFSVAARATTCTARPA